MSETSEIIEVTTTTASEVEAQTIARQLVSQRLAACVQVAGPIHSFYRWQGELCEAQEMRLTIKSLSRVQAPLIAALKAIHSYETPEIVVVTGIECSAEYAQWLGEQID